ncbi:hypothetical protein P879_11145 [Paragonimus westermani]|uniref:Uncharacterized protein n=1 Tax=Paragonimus westermani TaxID=34504 RepID=A0A8T0D9K1_9TREM|nr:hypothetical protein P879_11145 [Paragonimus westermani]
MPRTDSFGYPKYASWSIWSPGSLLLRSIDCLDCTMLTALLWFKQSCAFDAERYAVFKHFGRGDAIHLHAFSIDRAKPKQ